MSERAGWPYSAAGPLPKQCRDPDFRIGARRQFILQQIAQQNEVAGFQRADGLREKSVQFHVQRADTLAIEPERIQCDAEGVLAEVYAEWRKRGQWKDVAEGDAVIGSPYSVFTQNGAALKALDDWSRIVRFGRSELSRTQREMIATVTSRLNHCVF